ncbi:MAG: hypothetical protein ACI4P3_00435 [Candidatus Spyradosoma sp.]
MANFEFRIFLRERKSAFPEKSVLIRSIRVSELLLPSETSSKKNIARAEAAGTLFFAGQKIANGEFRVSNFFAGAQGRFSRRICFDLLNPCFRTSFAF